jgi:predicted nucleic acid-binding protein
LQNKILIDSSFLFTLYDLHDDRREKALAFAETDQRIRLVPDVVLTEVAFLLNRAGGQRAVRVFLKSFYASGALLEPITKDDLLKVEEIMGRYSDAHFDFVDCCLMALSERLNITQICTFDRRDFSIFRPTHCDYLELLP